jgi:uncharacterized phage-like protein YoqJ
MVKSMAYDVCFTGHRPQALGGFDEMAPMNAFVRRRLDAEVRRLYDAGARSFVSGMALGVDQWAAEVVLSLKAEHDDVRLVAAVPCEGQDSRWPLASRLKYRSLLGKADEVHTVTPGPYEAWKMQVRNEWMVDGSRLVLAVWNGTQSGGTYNCLVYARMQKKMVRRIDPRSTCA